MPNPTAAPASSRWLSVDVARGVAVLAMVAYHTGWDLSALRLVALEVTVEPGWILFARAIASSFLVLSGIGLALAHGRGLRRRAFLGRLALVAGAALLVSGASYAAFPDSWIFFGILHNIALSSVLALPFLRAPPALAALAALACWAVPAWLLGSALRPPLLDSPLLAFLGLGARLPLTNDFVPLLPWTGFVLAGLAVGRSVLPRLAGLPPLPATRPLRILAAIGRRSLAIYLLHQPLIYGTLYGVAELTGPREAVEEARYGERCERSCRAQGQPAERCRLFCACNLRSVRAEGLWIPVMRNVVSPDDVDRLAAIARSCARANP